MNSRTVRSTIIIAGLMLASSTFANTDIVKCTDDDGHVTLTDRQCDAGDDEVVVARSAPDSASVDDAAAPAEPLPQAVRTGDRYQLHALPPPPRMRAGNYANIQPPGRALARDVLTLQQARRTLMLMDSNVPTRLVAHR